MRVKKHDMAENSLEIEFDLNVSTDEDFVVIEGHQDQISLPMPVPVPLAILSYPRSVLEVIKTAGPYSGTLIIRTAGNTIGVIIVAQVGVDALAASGLFSQLITFITVIGLGIQMPIGILIARAYKTEDFHEIGRLYRKGLLNIFILSAPLIPLMCFISPILQMTGQNEEISDLTQTFFRGFFPTISAYFGLMAADFLLLGIDKAWITMVSSLAERLLFVGLAYIFIFGKFGFPEAGVLGLGLAYTVSSLLALFWINTILRWTPYFKRYQLFSLEWFPNWGQFGQIWRDGSMIALQQGLEVSTIMSLAMIAGRIGEESLASFQVGSQINTVFMIMSIVLAQGAAIKVSQAIGMRNMFNARRLGNVALAMQIIAPLIFTIIAFSIPRRLASLYIDDITDPSNENLVQMTRNALYIFALSSIVDAIRAGSLGALRGFLDTRFAMLMSGILLLGSTALAWGATALDFGVESIVSSRGLFLLIITIPLLVRWVMRSHKTIERIEADQEKPSCFGLWKKARNGATSALNSASSFFGYRLPTDDISAVLSEPSSSGSDNISWEVAANYN